MSVVVVSYNVRDLLRACLASWFRQPLSHTADVWVVDNASADGSAAMVAGEFPQVHLIANDENRGFAPGNNQAVRASCGRYVLFLNPDTEILSGSVDRVVDYMDAHPDVAVTGCRLVYADGSFQHSCFRFPGLAQTALDLWPAPRLMDSRLNGRYPRSAYAHEFDIDHPLGACFTLRRAAGLMFDEDFFLYVEEIDLSWRLHEAGWKLRYLPELTVLHHAGRSTSQTPSRSRTMLWQYRRVFNRKHRGPVYRAVWEALVRLGGVRL
ncbi:MAG TPA: glycosyltransferase family 2 protein [Chloroflexota bacterium]|nr:glycosyltransferase family 2 protein [Chloroflexota bacterium]